ncbi:MAG TPA: helix-turn-helix transcriptional regulator [Chloroflexota bacterium]|nr:helix-turn-helix transcriptional regulator [Chloroflexota bacterium]
MPRLSRAQDETRQRIARLTASGLSPEDFGARLLDALQRAVPSAGQRLFGVDPATLLVNRTLAASANDAWARQAWLREAYLASGPLTYLDFPNLMRAGLTAVAVHDRQDTCWGYPPQLLEPVSPGDHYHAFHENRAPIGGVLLVSIPADGRWIGALQLYRRDPKQPYRRGDVAFLRLVVPAIGEGLRAAFARERALASADAAPDASGILILGPDGRVRFSTPAAEAWSARLRDAAKEGHGPLPTAVWAAVAGLRGRLDGAASALVVPTGAGPVRVEASPGGEDGSIAVVLAPQRPSPPPDVPPDWPLTPAERQVIALLVRGLSNRQIAERLVVSENTVLSHLRHAYEKLGVGSRGQLLSRFFRETYWTALQVPGEIMPNA